MVKISFVKVFVLFLMLVSVAYGENDLSKVNLERYHKLKTSNVYFSSVKGKPFHIGIGFYKDDRERYFPGKINGDLIFGSMRFYALDRKEKIVEVRLKEVYWSEWSKIGLEQRIYFIADRVILDEGEYLVSFDIYVSKDIPADLNNIVMVSEVLSWK